MTVLSPGGALGRAVQQTLAREDLWKGSFGQVKEALRSGHSVCERWIQVCDTLTTQFWKRYGPHPWRGEKFVPGTLVQLSKRIEEVCIHYHILHFWVVFDMNYHALFS